MYTPTAPMLMASATILRRAKCALLRMTIGCGRMRPPVRKHCGGNVGTGNVGTDGRFPVFFTLGGAGAPSFAHFAKGGYDDRTDNSDLHAPIVFHNPPHKYLYSM